MCLGRTDSRVRPRDSNEIESRLDKSMAVQVNMFQRLWYYCEQIKREREKDITNKYKLKIGSTRDNVYDTDCVILCLLTSVASETLSTLPTHSRQGGDENICEEREREQEQEQDHSVRTGKTPAVFLREWRAPVVSGESKLRTEAVRKKLG